jgi:hypothetical protein
MAIRAAPRPLKYLTCRFELFSRIWPQRLRASAARPVPGRHAARSELANDIEHSGSS